MSPALATLLILARETGIARETLYKVTRREGNPTLDTIGRLAKALGFRLTLAPLPKPASKRLPAKAGASGAVVGAHVVRKTSGGKAEASTPRGKSAAAHSRRRAPT